MGEKVFIICITLENNKVYLEEYQIKLISEDFLLILIRYKIVSNKWQYINIDLRFIYERDFLHYSTYYTILYTTPHHISITQYTYI